MAAINSEPEFEEVVCAMARDGKPGMKRKDKSGTAKDEKRIRSPIAAPFLQNRHPRKKVQFPMMKIGKDYAGISPAPTRSESHLSASFIADAYPVTLDAIGRDADSGKPRGGAKPTGPGPRNNRYCFLSL